MFWFIDTDLMGVITVDMSSDDFVLVIMVK